jgi:hypothetical protein
MPVPRTFADSPMVSQMICAYLKCDSLATTSFIVGDLKKVKKEKFKGSTEMDSPISKNISYPYGRRRRGAKGRTRAVLLLEVNM